MKVFIIHGTFGKPNSNWFPWLKTELEKQGHTVFMPQFPTGIAKQNLTSWTNKINEYKEHLDDAVFIGHSLSPAFICTLLENHKAKAAFFVSAFFDIIGIDDYDTCNCTFITHDFDWAKIKKNCPKFFVYYSDNDPYVPQKSLIKSAKLVSAKPLIINGAGHINAESGYTKFPQLLKDFESIA
jgi:uncharacterized protein